MTGQEMKQMNNKLLSGKVAHDCFDRMHSRKRTAMVMSNGRQQCHCRTFVTCVV